MKTVGELKEFIKDLPNDMLLTKYQSNMETSGYRNNVFFQISNMEKETRETWDRFDGTLYKYEVMVDSENGTQCLKIY